MSQENVEIVGRMHDQAHDDPEAFFDLLDDEVEWRESGPFVPKAGLIVAPRGFATCSHGRV